MQRVRKPFLLICPQHHIYLLSKLSIAPPFTLKGIQVIIYCNRNQNSGNLGLWGGLGDTVSNRKQQEGTSWSAKKSVSLKEWGLHRCMHLSKLISLYTWDLHCSIHKLSVKKPLINKYLSLNNKSWFTLSKRNREALKGLKQRRAPTGLEF